MFHDNLKHRQTIKVKTALEQRNKELDKAINGLTKNGGKYSDSAIKISLKGLFKDAGNIVKLKLKRRLEQITKLEAFEHRLPNEFIEFMSTCKRWLSNIISLHKLNEKSFGDKFQITPLGDIYLKSGDKKRGICLTSKTQIISGEFKNGLLQSGEATVLLKDGQLYK